MSNELSKATLERKDKDELTQIAAAMGGKPSSRARKAQIIDLIMELAGVGEETGPDEGGSDGDAGSDEASTDDEARVSGGQTRTGNGSGGAGDGATAAANGAGAAQADESRGYTADPMADARAEADAGNRGGAQQRNGASQQQDTPEPGNRKRRRRGRNRDRGDDAEEWSGDPVEVEGYLDLRDDGYGFLRVNGALPSKEDVYVSVKQARQFGLRKGDHLAGAGRPASRSEKNPALVRIDSVNGREPEQAVNRAEFEELTPLFPDEQMVLAGGDDDVTARLIDLVSPVGKGSRGLIVSPPGAGKTTVLTQLARAIEANHPDVEVMIILLDERPEEVTEMARALERSVVLASTFDRPADEHCAVAELGLERAKRRVELENDVVVIIDGLTRLGRAYSAAAGGSGSGLDPAVIFPAKRFFGAARKVEEGGSLTILATAATETGSDVDRAILEEFEGTANMILELDRAAARRQVFPAVNVGRSATRRLERLVGDDGVAQRRALRAALSQECDDDVVAMLEALIARVAASSGNDALLAGA